MAPEGPQARRDAARAERREMAAEERARSVPRSGVVWTPNGFELRRASAKSSKKATIQLLDSVDGCKCDGPVDEDKGPRCSCYGDPKEHEIKHEFSDSEVNPNPKHERNHETNEGFEDSEVNQNPEHE